jgi:hypothetical protein
MKNKNSLERYTHIALLLFGSAFMFFDSNEGEGLRSVLMFAGVYIIFLSLIEIVKRVFFNKKNKEVEQYPLPITDERIEKMSLKFMAQILALSHFIGFIILLTLYVINKNMTIRVEYVLYYVLAVLFFTFMFGLKIVKRIDN